MSDDILEVEAQRVRWRRARSSLRLDDPERPDFGRGGLGRFVRDLSVRFLILPMDPDAALLSFDDDFWAWWMESRSNPFEGAGETEWGIQKTPTVDVAVRYDRWNGDRWSWDRYLALHRNGGLEFGLGQDGASQWQEGDGALIRGFRLVNIVGRVWAALHHYNEVLGRVTAEAPWEATLALVNTQGAWMGNVGAGWKDFDGWRHDRFVPTCPEPNLRVSRELGRWPEPAAVNALAFDFGSVLDDAWGVMDRRFLAHKGHHGEGAFDVSRYN